MAITKTRINISIPKEVRQAVTRLAKRDAMPEATKAAQLLEHALQFEEDEVWNEIATRRDRPRAKFFSHKRAWV